MAIEFDRETIEAFRSRPAGDVLRAARSAVFRAGSVGSEDFLDVYQQLVDEGILSWAQIEEFEDS